MNNDLSLLRPFDLEAAKAGAPICTRDGRAARFIAHVPELDEAYRVIAHIEGAMWSNSFRESGTITHALGKTRVDLCMAPICWVEGRPVYLGDLLYDVAPIEPRGRVVVTDLAYNGSDVIVADHGYNCAKYLTWNPPTVKREGFCIVHPTTVYESFEQAEARMKRDYPEGCFIAECKWEEPAP